MKTTVRVSTVLGISVFRVRDPAPIVDVTGTTGRAVIYEQPFDRYYCLLTVGGKVYPGSERTPRRALRVAIDIVYRERKSAGPPAPAAVWADLEPLVSSIDDAVNPKDREVLE